MGRTKKTVKITFQITEDERRLFNRSVLRRDVDLGAAGVLRRFIREYITE